MRSGSRHGHPVVTPALDGPCCQVEGSKSLKGSVLIIKQALQDPSFLCGLYIYMLRVLLVPLPLTPKCWLLVNLVMMADVTDSSPPPTLLPPLLLPHFFVCECSWVCVIYVCVWYVCVHVFMCVGAHAPVFTCCGGLRESSSIAPPLNSFSLASSLWRYLLSAFWSWSDKQAKTHLVFRSVPGIWIPVLTLVGQIL